MALIVKPGHGLEGLSFGSPKDKVRRFFGSGFTCDRRTDGSRPYDYWSEVSVFAYYDECNLLEALEFASDADLIMDGTALFGLSGNEVVQFLRERDTDVLIEEQGTSVTSVTSERLGLGVWIPEASEIEARPESVVIFRDGYYST